MIDLNLTNNKFSFKNTQSFETGLNDHYHMVYTFLKTSFQKSEPKQFICRDFKNFYFESSENDLPGKKRLPVTDRMMNVIENLLRY